MSLYTKGTRVKTLFEKNVTFTAEGDNVVALVSDVTILIPGQIYRVELDGVNYETTARKVSGDDVCLILGDAAEIRDRWAFDDMQITIYGNTDTTARSVKIANVNYDADYISPELLHTPDLSQNDPTAPDYVKNRTHYESVEIVNEPLNITWDGNTEGLLRVNSIYYKISDLVLTDEQIKSITYTDSSGTTIVVANNWNMMVNMGMAHEGGAPLGTYCYVVKKDGAVIDGETFNEAGIYFVSFSGVYVTSLTTTEPVPQPKTVVKKLDKKFLPETTGGGQFVVTFEHGDDGYTMDKTLEEIAQAVESGYTVVGHTDADIGFMCRNEAPYSVQFAFLSLENGGKIYTSLFTAEKIGDEVYIDRALSIQARVQNS